MTVELFLLLLMAVSTLTSAVVQAIKTMLDGMNKKYHSNVLAGVVAVVLGLVIGIGYVLFTGMTVTVQTVIWVIALMALGWLCSMLGYDKVKQLLMQIK